MLKKSPIDVSQPLQVGPLQLRNRAFLAPMSGVTDLPFRRLAWEFGAGMVVSEMVASHALVDGEELMWLKLKSAHIPFHVVQLAGREAKWMSLAAKMAEAHGADMIDINMGCPSRRVTTGLSGSALMCDLDHAMSLVDAVVEAVDVPVTLKMRLGWDHNSLNAADLAKRAENAGVQMITVHGRTRCQFYKGEADWDAVRSTKDVLSIPLVVNGDIAGIDDVRLALLKSDADAVMIGRGAYGAPWMPGLLAGNSSYQHQPTGSVMIKRHHEDMLSFYGVESGIRQARKHLGWYLNSMAPADVDQKLKKKLMTSFEPDEIHHMIDEIFIHSNHNLEDELSAA